MSKPYKTPWRGLMTQIETYFLIVSDVQKTQKWWWFFHSLFTLVLYHLLIHLLLLYHYHYRFFWLHLVILFSYITIRFFWFLYKAIGLMIFVIFSPKFQSKTHLRAVYGMEAQND